MSKLQNIIESSGGKFISVTFIKKDGSTRVLVGRLGVTKHLKGGQSTLDPAKFITIYDTQKEGYRAINRETIQSVRLDGEEYFA
jgi:WYL_2, Sm-like SH3 beta-barrel fold